MEWVHSLLHVPYIPSAPPSAPTNLTTTALNATSVLLAWGPPSGAQSPSLFYRVLVTSGNGTLVYDKTVKELQLILTTPDPCDQYWANVTTVYVNLNSIVCTGNSIMNAINGGESNSFANVQLELEVQFAYLNYYFYYSCVLGCHCVIVITTLYFFSRSNTDTSTCTIIITTITFCWYKHVNNGYCHHLNFLTSQILT